MLIGPAAHFHQNLLQLDDTCLLQAVTFGATARDAVSAQVATKSAVRVDTIGLASSLR